MSRTKMFLLAGLAVAVAALAMFVTVASLSDSNQTASDVSVSASNQPTTPSSATSTGQPRIQVSSQPPAAQPTKAEKCLSVETANGLLEKIPADARPSPLTKIVCVGDWAIGTSAGVDGKSLFQKKPTGWVYHSSGSYWGDDPDMCRDVGPQVRSHLPGCDE